MQNTEIKVASLSEPVTLTNIIADRFSQLGDLVFGEVYPVRDERFTFQLKVSFEGVASAGYDYPYIQYRLNLLTGEISDAACVFGSGPYIEDEDAEEIMDKLANRVPESSDCEFGELCFPRLQKPVKPVDNSAIVEKLKAQGDLVVEKLNRKQGAVKGVYKFHLAFETSPGAEDCSSKIEMSMNILTGEILSAILTMDNGVGAYGTTRTTRIMDELASSN